MASRLAFGKSGKPETQPCAGTERVTRDEDVLGEFHHGAQASGLHDEAGKKTAAEYPVEASHQAELGQPGRGQ